MAKRGGGATQKAFGVHMAGFAAGLRLTVIGTSGAVVRREADLGSPVVATLARGATRFS